jgi:pimeloyl-ACP methyl ester carboxylesterase
MSGTAATFVLVHGAWQGNWVWERVASGLRAAGQTVFTPSLTGIGERAHLSGPSIDLDTHIADVLGTIEHHELDRIVLVGHSYGGMVIGGVADRIPRRIVSLVFLDAFIPVAGKSILDFLPPEHAAALRAGAEKEGQGWRVKPIPAAVFRVARPDDSARIDRQAVDHPLAAMEQKSAVTGVWATVPRLVYIRASGQPPEPFAQFADQVRTDPKWQYFELPCGHNAMLDLPEALIGVLLGCAARTADASSPEGKITSIEQE